MTKELLQQALEALEHAQGNINPERGFADEAEADITAAITALREALAAPMPEPVGKVLAEGEMIGYDRRGGDVIWWNKPPGPAMLYAAPPAAPAPAVPLTDEQINAIWNAKDLPEHRSNLSPWGMDRIRAIIAAASGIGGGNG